MSAPGRRAVTLRELAAIAGALAYPLVALWLGSGDAAFYDPLGRFMTFSIPAAVGLILSLATPVPDRRQVLTATPALMAFAVACAITFGWLPLAYFWFVGGAMLLGLVAGALAGALITPARTRGWLALVVVFTPVRVALRQTSLPAPRPRVEVDAAATVTSSPLEVWEEVLGADTVVRGTAIAARDGGASPSVTSIALDDTRPRSWRHIRYDDGSHFVERVVERDDGDWLRVETLSQNVEVPTGWAAWRAGWDEAAVQPMRATYTLKAVGDTATSIVLTGTWRLTRHQRAYPEEWYGRVAHAKAEQLLATIRARAAARGHATAPLLTAEMRQLRSALVAELASPSPAVGARLAFVDSARKVAQVGALSRASAEAGAANDADLRAALRAVADRARTTAWAVRDGDALRLEYEDYRGRCVAERVPVRAGVPGVNEAAAQRTPCEPVAMVERARRSRVIAERPFKAGDEKDHWSVVLVAFGVARVYLDSVVLATDSLRLTVEADDSIHVVVDAVVASLAQKSGASWSPRYEGTARGIRGRFPKGETLTHPHGRFVIRADSSVNLTQVWPVFQLVLSMPPRPDNPEGRAWTYAHAPETLFADVRR